MKKKITKTKTRYQRFGFSFIFWALVHAFAVVACASAQVKSPYVVSSEGTLLYQTTWGSWRAVKGRGLPQRWVYPFTKQEKRPLNALAFDPMRPQRLLAANSRQLFFSEDGGDSFRPLGEQARFSNYAFFTALALSPHNTEEMLLGTSFDGIYQTLDGGKTWKDLNSKLRTISLGGVYFENIQGLAYSSIEGQVYIAYGDEGKVLLFDLIEGRVLRVLSLPRADLISRLELVLDGSQRLYAFGLDRIWLLEGETWIDKGKNFGYENLTKEKRERLRRSYNKRGIYLTAWTISDSQRWKRHLDFIEKKGLNAVVIDFKDDTGWVLYHSQVPLARQVGAIRSLIDVQKIVKEAHDRGIYVIARVVVFKDKKLYEYNQNQYALWNTRDNEPWRYLVTQEDGQKIQKEFWVDLYSSEVWKYNIDIAQELEQLGIDEIQFDYIRFPSDGPVSLARSRFNTRSMQHVDALESFLRMARENLSLPLSIDIFGYNSWFLTEHLGQNASRLAPYVDVISPMLYPSHFSSDFLPGLRYYTSRAHRIYRQGTNNTFLMAHGNIHVRSYVQSFLIGSERAIDESMYYQYLRQQISGINASRGNGFLLWNASNNYYMVPHEDLSSWVKP